MSLGTMGVFEHTRIVEPNAKEPRIDYTLRNQLLNKVLVWLALFDYNGFQARVAET